MKKFGKIVVLMLSLIVAFGAFVFAVSAEDAPFLVEGLYRYTWEEAIDNAGGDVSIKLLSDYTVSEGESVVVDKSVTIDLNGHSVISSDSETALFVVNGEDVELTIVGPGSINVAGTFIKVEGEKSSVKIFASETGIKISSNSEKPIFDVSGKLDIDGKITVDAKMPAALINLNPSATLNLLNAKVSMTGKTFEAAVPLVSLSAASKVNVKHTEIVTGTGVVFAVKGITDVATPAVVLCEYAKFTSSSMAYGNIIDAADEYLYATFRLCDISASGAAFAAADTMADFTYEGEVKTYAAPKASVYLTKCNYSVPVAEQNSPCIYYGNITGVISGGILDVRYADIASHTRLWDGTNGIFIKAGTKCIGDMSSAAQIQVLLNKLKPELDAPIQDADSVTVFFNPESQTNKNFSFDSIDGKTCYFYAETKITPEHKADSYFVLGIAPEYSYTVDSGHSTNFQSHSLIYYHSNPAIPSVGSGVFTPIANGIGSRYGESEILDSADGNRYYRFTYKQEDYLAGNYIINSSSYVGVFVGSGINNKAPEHPTYLSDYITIDFDIATDTFIDGVAQYTPAGMPVKQRAGDSTQYQSNKGITLAYSSGLPILKVGEGEVYKLPNSAGVWTHITYLFEIDSSETLNADGTHQKYNLSKSKLHIYVNGQFLGTTTVFAATADTVSEAVYKAISLDEMRLGLTDKDSINASIKDNSICFDNIVVTHYKNGYQGDIQKLIDDKTLNLNTASDVIYNKDYQMPGATDNNTPVVVVDDEPYFDMSEGLASVGEGSVVELFADVPGVYNATSSFTVYTNGYNFAVESSTHYIAPVYGEVNAYKISKANNYVPVYWDVDNYGNTTAPDYLYLETNVPFGIVPTNTATFGADINGLWKSLVGWSYTKGASVPDEIRPISKEDIDRGFVCLYPVFEYTKVRVTFLDQSGAPLGEAVWVDVGTDVSELVRYNDGTIFPLLAVEGTDWYKLAFSGWALKDSTDTEIGIKTYTAQPLFEKAVVTAIKQNFTLTRLTRLYASAYVMKADGISDIVWGGIYSNAACTTAMTTTKVTIGGVSYLQVSLIDTATGVRIDELDNYKCYVKFTYLGREHVQEIKVDIEKYLVSLLTKENATDAEKSVALETMRFVNASLVQLGKEQIASFTQYLNDENYKAKLINLEKVSTDLFSDGEKDKTKYQELLTYIKTPRYEYASNTMFLVTQDGYKGVSTQQSTEFNYNFILAYVNEANSSKRLNVGRNGPKTGGEFMFSFNDDKRSKVVYNYDDFIVIRYYGATSATATSRPLLTTSYLSWAAYITILEENPNADRNELEYARIVYAMHYSIKTAAGANNVTPEA